MGAVVFLFFFLVCGPFTVVCAATPEVASSPSGEFTLLGEQTVGLGEIPPYGTTNVVFRVRNTGSGPLKISNLLATCTCIKARAEKDVVAPGEETAVHFTLIASQVHGTFKRSLWIETDAKRNGRMLVSVAGSVRPLFTGLPEMPIRLVSSHPGTVWTNRYLLMPTESGVSLGIPEIVTNAMRMTCSITTNRTDTQTVYAVTLVAEPLESGKSAGRVVLPSLVPGRDDVPPVAFVFHAMSGAKLRVTPSTVVLHDTGAPLKRRLRVTTQDRRPDPRYLTWEPAIEGVNVEVSDARSRSGMAVTLTLSPKAVKTLIGKKAATLTFRYANHDPVAVTFGEAAIRRNLPSAASNVKKED